jgi:parvulin-like peptidyl-prolyl isomerase
MSPKLVSLLVVTTLATCAREIPREDRVVLEVAGEPVTMEEFDRFVSSSVQRDVPLLSPEVLGALFEQFIEEQLLLKRADEAGIQADPRAVAKRMEALESGEAAPADATIRSSDELLARSLERQVRVETLLETEVLFRVTVEEDEIAEHYERNRMDYVRPETVDVSQILVEEEEEAREIRSALTARKAAFEDLARERSQGPESSRGGHLGAFARGELPPSFESEIFALKPGAISEVVSTDFGYHLFRVNQTTPETSLALDDVRESIRVELLRAKSEEAMQRYLGELEQRYPVMVHHEHLDFAVAGRAERAGSLRWEKSR